MRSKFDIREFMTSVRREAGEERERSLGPAGLRALLSRRGDDFVRQAYWQILNRDVDPDGLKAFGPRARQLPGRAIVLLSLLLSPERVLLPPWLRKLIRAAGALVRPHE